MEPVESLQTKEVPGVVETVQLEHCQGLQTRTVVLLLGCRRLILQAHHPREKHTNILIWLNNDIESTKKLHVLEVIHIP
jgi:hypothetical protein